MIDSNNRGLAVGDFSDQISVSARVAARGADSSAGDVSGAVTARAPSLFVTRGEGRVPGTEPATRHASLDTLAGDQAKAQICEEFLRLTSGENPLSLRMAAAQLKTPASFFAGRDSVLARYLRDGVAGITRNGDRSQTAATGDLTKQIEALPWFIPAAEFFYLLSNRNRYSGSVPEAIRRTISLPVIPNGWPKKTAFLKKLGRADLPVCPIELREAILLREREGKPLVPERIARMITARSSAAVVQFSRNPTEAALRFANASGGSKFSRASGEYVPLRAGRRMMPDDGSINFCVCVPWQFPTSTTSRKFGVLVGRFQLLLFVDTLTQRISARSFVIRPRESYRTEDALHLYNIFMRQHGVPDEIYHEGHVWNSGRVKDCLDLLKVRRQLLHSPHAKQAVEGRFNKLWTVLSVLSGGQIGRYRGEMERENELLRSCRAGATDPRRVFPMLDVALPLIDQAIEEANATVVNTDVGSWVPDEVWAEHLAETPLRQLDEQHAWMFWPCAEDRTLRNGAKISFPLFEELSVPFCFAAPWMPEYEGARARIYFDPWGDRGVGKVVLRQSWGDLSAGAILGDATQTNDIANYARLMLGFGSGPNDAARQIRQQQISAMRSNRKAIVSGGRGLTVDEARDGISRAAKLETEGGRSNVDDGRNIAPQIPDRSAQREELRRFELDNQELFL